MIQTKKKVVLITSGQPTLNPRLVKEADILSDFGYEVTVIYQFWNNWATEYDKMLLAGKKWRAIQVGGNPDNKAFLYWLTRLKHKIYRVINTYISIRLFPELSIGRCTQELYNRAITISADLYIAHNLPALPVAIKAAKKRGAKCGFDAEDFHRYETSDSSDDITVKLNSLIENKYMPQADYITSSSELISQQYRNILNKSVQTILNVFSKNTSRCEESRGGHLIKLFWFSQTIGKNRGIEQAILALANLPQGHFELNLLGELTVADHSYFSRFLKKNGVQENIVKFHQPIAESEIVSFASKHDIGLAMETGKPFNRDICLTNKIFTYIQAGLAVLATDTSAQKDLLKKYPNMGFTYKTNNTDDLTHKLFYYLNTAILENSKRQSYIYGQDVLNWEVESKKFLYIINKVLNH